MLFPPSKTRMSEMETTADPLATMLLTGGGSAGTMGLLMYLFMTKFKNGNGNSPDQDSGMREVCHKLDQTNELLNELLRSQARTEGLLQNLNHRG